MIIIWWVLFTLVSFAMNWLPAMFGLWKDPSLKHTILWHGVWLLWIPLTFLVYLISVKYPVTRANLTRSLLLYFLLGCLFTVLHTGLDTLVNLPIRRFLFNEIHFESEHIVVLFTNKFNTNLVIFWSITGACHAYLYFTKFQKTEILAAQLENQLTRSQLQALKMQLHPHFLFNTHHSIVSLMTANRNREAIEMMTQLSDLLRITLEKKDQQFASLSEELNLIDLYLNIQKIRFKERILIEQKIETETLCCRIPTLLLQPIVENAFKHGIEHSLEEGKLVIGTRRDGEYLEIVVTNNGSGKNFSNTQQSFGIGLKSTKDRLEYIYDSDYYLNIESNHLVGAMVTIRLPFQISTPKDN